MSRDIVFMCVAPGEFLVRCDADLAEVKQGIEKLVKGSPCDVQPVDDRTCGELESRLSPARLSLYPGLQPQVTGLQPRTYQLRVDPRLANFQPLINQAAPPLRGGAGPVGVTVGAGIAGKF
ncbi:MAG: hypothetical protein HY720_03985 [Planctomycetes bacterium]|nr:hypothetical protein [Planctomycetota bacterium]